jgi:prephenate dehydrogenase
MSNLSKLRVAIIGLGQIGGSIGLDLVASESVADVIGFDSGPGVALQAVAQNAIDSPADTLDEALGDADLIILATPIRATVRLIPRIARRASSSAIILDVVGTKVGVMANVREAGLADRYVSGHPMAGHEGIGFEAARSRLFHGSDFALTVDDGVQPAHLEQVCALVRLLGARPFLIEAERHDEVTALTIHLAHVAALAMGSLVENETQDDDSWLSLSGGSLRSLVRVGGSSPQLILDMLATNKGHVIGLVDQLIGRLTEVKEALDEGDEDKIREMAGASSRVKRRLDERTRGISQSSD